MDPVTLVTQERMSFGREPIVLIGDPRRCQGVVRIHNPCSARVKLRQLRLRTAEKALSRGCDDVVVHVSASLCPGETQLSHVTVRLPPGTPPGEYQASLEGADETSVPVTIQVLESYRLRLSPAAITLGCRPGEAVLVRTSASNLGNVAVNLPKGAVVELQVADRGWRHHFHAAAGARSGAGYAGFLDELVKRIGGDEPPFGRAKLRAGAGPLAPQETRLLELEVALPKRLRTRRKYRALVRIGDARLQLMLHVSGTQAPSKRSRVSS